jgi:hypothetical protein
MVVERPELIKHGESFIKSMEELVTHYLGAVELGISKNNYTIKFGKPCLLCNPLDCDESYHSVVAPPFDHMASCVALGCPWIVMTGLTCDGYYKTLSNPSVTYLGPIYHSTDKAYQMFRVIQLREWIAAYKKYFGV